MNNVKLNEGFSQVCVWPGTVVNYSGNPANLSEGEKMNEIAQFVEFMKDNFGVCVQYLEEILTNPDPDDCESGGRNDLFFAVADEDIGKFAIPRLQYGIRWIEDALSSVNRTAYLYPERVKEYCCWDADEDAE